MSLRSPCLDRAILLLLILALMPAFTEVAQAAVASKHFPNDQCTLTANIPISPPGPAFRTLGVNIAYRKGALTRYFTLSTVCSDTTAGATFGDPKDTVQGCPLSSLCPNTVTGPFTCLNQLKEPQCMTGPQVTTRMMKAICYQAVGKAAGFPGYSVNGGAIANGTQCDTLVGGLDPVTLQITDVDFGCGFSITKNAEGLDFDKTGGCQFEGVITTNNGTTQQVDMLRRYFVQVDPNGQTSGSFTFNLWSVNASLAGPPTCSFSVAYNNPDIHQAIEDGFRGVNPTSCLSLNLSAQKRTSKFSSRFATIGLNPGLPMGDDNTGATPGTQIWNPSLPFVVIVNAGTMLNGVTVTATAPSSGNLPIVHAETSNDPPSGIPALNPWGVAILVAVLLLSSLWFFRRQAKAREV